MALMLIGCVELRSADDVFSWRLHIFNMLKIFVIQHQRELNKRNKQITALSGKISWDSEVIINIIKPLAIRHCIKKRLLDSCLSKTNRATFFFSLPGLKLFTVINNSLWSLLHSNCPFWFVYAFILLGFALQGTQSFFRLSDDFLSQTVQASFLFFYAYKIYFVTVVDFGRVLCCHFPDLDAT